MSVSGFAAGKCWDGACPKEVSACLNDKNCAKLNGCLVAKDQACIDGFKGDKATVDLFNAAYNCGGTACIGSCSAKVCADNTKGKLPDGTDGKCYCDDACAGQKSQIAAQISKLSAPPRRRAMRDLVQPATAQTTPKVRPRTDRRQNAIATRLAKAKKCPIAARITMLRAASRVAMATWGRWAKTLAAFAPRTARPKQATRKLAAAMAVAKCAAFVRVQHFAMKPQANAWAARTRPTPHGGTSDTGALAVNDAAADSGAKAAAAGSAAPAKSGCTTSTNGSNSATLLALMALGFAGLIWRKRRA